MTVVALDAIRLAVGTLTRIRVPAPTSMQAPRAGLAMVLAPLTALPAALVVVGAGSIAMRVPDLSVLSAAATMAAIAWLSRGMHLDGLSDTADGLAASYDRDRALEIMTRGNSGPAGVATLVCVLLVQTTALAAAFGGPLGVTLGAVAVIASRCTLSVVCRRGAVCARPGGLGSTVIGAVPPTLAYVCSAAVLALGCVAGALSGSWWAGVVVVVATIGSGVAFGFRASHRLGGYTGDVLGAVVEVSITAGLITAAVLAALVG